MLAYTFAIILLTLGHFRVGDSLKCYSCSNKDYGCLDKFIPRRIDQVKCLNVYDEDSEKHKRLTNGLACVKLKYKRGNNRQEEILRECDPGDISCDEWASTLVNGNPNEHINVTYCGICRSHLCNSAPNNYNVLALLSFIQVCWLFLI